jgi:hypothetical protein
MHNLTSSKYAVERYIAFYERHELLWMKDLRH